MNNLAAMGLTYRGVFQMEVGDEFAVIRCAREQGIPGILIEHGFISNYGDVVNYFSDDGCRRLGEADAAQSSRSSRIPTPSMEFPSRKNWDMRGQR